MTRPNLLPIGASRAGTMSLCAGLSRRPDVFMAPVKEPDCFSFDDNHRAQRERYQGLLDGVDREVAVGEASTTYSICGAYPATVKRIAGDLPGVRRLRTFAAARDRMPTGPCTALHRLFKRPISERPSWRPETRPWLLDRLREEMRRFLDYCGRPADSWIGEGAGPVSAADEEAPPA